MSILIKGMEMPKNCAVCFFHKVFPATGVGINQLYCALCGINIVKLSDAQPDCPLVPVPPHGDLIDKDATRNAILEERGEDTACWFAGIVNDMPAIVPSDKAVEGET